jgi:hypothetical protein
MVLRQQAEMPEAKTVEQGRRVTADEITITFTFDYPYDAFPQDLALYFSTSYSRSSPTSR